MTEQRQKIKHTKRWVIKVGSALLTNNGYGLRVELIEQWIAQIMRLREQGIEVVLVSSGAVAEGVARLGLQKRPTSLHNLQAAAAVGQMGLIQAYESSFKKYEVHTAQILLTHDDVANRQRYLNARMSLKALIDLGVVPIVNENDTVSTEEIRFGDNDTLAGLVANLIEADLLVILTDQDGLFTADPRKDSSAELISEADAGREDLRSFAGEGGELGRGGMQTKLNAAEVAARSATPTVIASGLQENVLNEIYAGKNLGTLLYVGTESLTARKQWLASQSHVQGKLILDDGAVQALQGKGKSLLAAGVKEVLGSFKRGEIVACGDSNGHEFARGLINYDSTETDLIKGKQTDEFQGLLGYVDQAELIHRDNLVIFDDNLISYNSK